jgi:conjugative transfer pilus assembly protein TraH
MNKRSNTSSARSLAFALPLRKITIASIAVSMAIAPPQAVQANALDSMLQGMYVAAGSPGVYKTQNANVLSLGYTAVRTPIMAPNIIAFVPPNISAGCGGINMFFGSWSFITAQQLQQLITAIGQAAPVFLFEMAINSMCPSCASELHKLQDQIAKMNSLVHNSCQLARGLLTGQGPNMLKSFTDSATGAFQAATGLVNDAFEGAFGKDQDQQSWWQRFQSALSPANNSESGGGTAKKGDTSPVSQVGYGNQTWKAIVTNNVTKMLVGTEDAFTAELLMSLLGTVIVSDQAKDNNPSASTTTPANTNGNPSGNTLELSGSGESAALLSLDALVEGDPNARVMRCMDYTSPSGVTYGAYTGDGGTGLDPLGCWRVKVDDSYTLGSNGYNGLRTAVNCALFGTPGTYANGYGPQASCAYLGNPKGIVNEIKDGTVISNSAEIALLNMSPIPIGTLLQRVSDQPAMLTAIASHAQPFIVAAVAVSYAEQLKAAAQNAFQNSSKTFTKPANYETRMMTLEAEKQKYVEQLTGVVDVSNALMSYVNNYLAMKSQVAPGTTGPVRH